MTGKIRAGRGAYAEKRVKEALKSADRPDPNDLPGWTVRDLCHRTRLARNTVYRWLNVFEYAGQARKDTLYKPFRWSWIHKEESDG